MLYGAKRRRKKKSQNKLIDACLLGVLVFFLVNSLKIGDS